MSQAKLTKAVKSFSASFRSITGAYLSGKLDLDAWYDDAYDAIFSGHRDAWIIGRQMGGDLSVPSTDDDVEARRKADFETERLDRFREKLSAGYYDDKPEAALSRSDLYALSARGSATEAWAATSDSDDVIRWRLGDSEHCEDCIELAAQRFTTATLYAYPGQSDTICGSHCNCHLERVSDGKESPKRIILND